MPELRQPTANMNGYSERHDSSFLLLRHLPQVLGLETRLSPSDGRPLVGTAPDRPRSGLSTAEAAAGAPRAAHVGDVMSVATDVVAEVSMLSQSRTASAGMTLRRSRATRPCTASRQATETVSRSRGVIVLVGGVG